MTNFNFDIPDRYDDKIANDGIWFECYDKSDNHWGDFRIKFTDRESDDQKKLISRLQVKYKKDAGRGSNDDRDEAIRLDIFIGLALAGWRNVKANGKDVPYSEDAARAYFSQPKVREFVLPILENYSRDSTNYGAEPKEVVAGN